MILAILNITEMFLIFVVLVFTWDVSRGGGVGARDLSY